MRPQFDERDQGILDARLQRWNQQEGPRVGDWLLMLDGTERRFTHRWEDRLQVQYKWHNGNVGHGSFYFAGDCMSYSGSLDDAIPLDQIEKTDGLRDAPAWFFHHDEWRAHNGVDVTIPCRVFRQCGE